MWGRVCGVQRHAHFLRVGTAQDAAKVNRATDVILPRPSLIEKIMNNLNPTFVKSIRVDYFFEEVQMLRFQASFPQPSLLRVDPSTNPPRIHIHGPLSAPIPLR